VSGNNWKILLLVFTIITWGYSWVLMKQSLEYMQPFTFVALRNAIAAAVLLPFILLHSSYKHSNFKNPNYIIVGIFQTTAMMAFIIYGMKFVTAGKTSVIVYTMPLWTSLLLHFLLKERLNNAKWIGVILGIFGTAFILGWDAISVQSVEIIYGELLIILAAISWAIANIWNRKKLREHNPLIVNGYQLIFGAAFLIIIAYIIEGSFRVDWNYHSIFIILFTGIVASAINFSIWFYLINKFDINITTFSSLLVPIVALTFDRIILGTKLDVGVLLGGVLIVLSIYKISKSKA